jgi:hypothetical protein
MPVFGLHHPQGQRAGLRIGLLAGTGSLPDETSSRRGQLHDEASYNDACDCDGCAARRRALSIDDSD